MFAVIYRTGGYAACRWRLTSVSTQDKANTLQESLTRMGYKTIVRTEGEHAALGMPVGWASSFVDESDVVTVTAGETHHEVSGAERLAQVRALYEALPESERK